MLARTPLFPAGTAVKVYVDRGLAASGEPSGTAIQTQTMGQSSLTFTGLSAGRYIAAALVSGSWRASRFQIPEPVSTSIADEAATREAADAALGTRIDGISAGGQVFSVGAASGGDDTETIATAIEAANDVAGLVSFTPGEEYVMTPDASGVSVGDGVRLQGNGATIRCAENPTDGVRLFGIPNGASATFRDLRILGPATWEDEATFIAIETLDTTTGLRLEDCLIRGFRYSIRGSADSETLWDLSGSEFDGGGVADGTDGFGAHGVVHSGGPGAAVHADNCHFHHFGNFNGDNLNHALYIYTSVSWRIKDCRFEDQQGGFYLTSFGGTGDAEYAIFEDNYCAPMTDNFIAIQTNPTVHTLVRGTTFAMGRRGIVVQGDCTIEDCTFTGDGEGDFWQLEITDASDYTVAVNGCRFLGSNNITDVLIQTGSAIKVNFSDCVFETNSDRAIHLDPDSTDAVVSVDGCTFLGTDDTAGIYAAGGNLQVHNNRFYNAGRGIHTTDSDAPDFLAFSHNDFSQGGSSVRFGAEPTDWEAHDNYGSVGFPTANGGTASVANGGTIAHGLGSGAVPITPSRFGLTPSVAKRLASVTAKDDTNLTISLHDDTGAAKAVAENVAWWAEL